MKIFVIEPITSKKFNLTEFKWTFLSKFFMFNFFIITNIVKAPSGSNTTLKNGSACRLNPLNALNIGYVPPSSEFLSFSGGYCFACGSNEISERSNTISKSKFFET